MSFLRQTGILDPEQIIFPVTVIGLGGIGRHAAETLAQMGCGKMILIDPDTVEEHNRPNQSYRLQDLGRKKTEATQDILKGFAEWCETSIISEKLTKESGPTLKPLLEGVVVSGVDSMQSRMDIWELIRYNPNIPLYIDGRIGAEYIKIFTVRPCQMEDVEFYEQTLFPDSKMAQLPCTAQQIIYTGKIIGALMALQVKKWLKKEPLHREMSLDLGDLDLLLDKNNLSGTIQTR